MEDLRLVLSFSKSHNVKYLIQDEDLQINNTKYLKKYSFTDQKPLIKPVKVEKNNLLYIHDRLCEEEYMKHGYYKYNCDIKFMTKGISFS